MVGHLELNVRKYKLLYNSTRRGFVDRDTRESQAYFGRLMRDPKQIAENQYDRWWKQSVEATCQVLVELPPGFMLEKTVETVAALDPKSGDEMLLLRVPAFHPRH